MISPYLEYQKQHFAVDGAEFYSIHAFLDERSGAAKGCIHEIGERLNGLGDTPVASFSPLAERCCFTPKTDGIFNCRTILENDLTAEKEVIRAR
jgi:DNA-binding ferritin-like protein